MKAEEEICDCEYIAEKWTESEVCTWLHSFGMSKYAEVFLAKEVTGAVLMNSVDDQALREELEIKSRMHRNTILTQIRRLRSGIKNKELDILMDRERLEIEKSRADLRKSEEIERAALRREEEEHKMQLRAEEEDRKLAREMERYMMQSGGGGYIATDYLIHDGGQNEGVPLVPKVVHHEIYMFRYDEREGGWLPEGYSYPFSARLRWECTGCGYHTLEFTGSQCKTHGLQLKPKTCPNA